MVSDADFSSRHHRGKGYFSLLMSFIQSLVNIALHLNTELPAVIKVAGPWTYLLMFAVIFIETGLVILPFLPGDSLLFTAGAISALHGSLLDPRIVFPVMALAAVLGDTNNYWIGHALGKKVYTGQYRWIRKDYLDRTREFYHRHGRKTILLARFIPIIRSFAPFVAGVGRMTYLHFFQFNVIGGVLWAGLLIGIGYFFGNLPVVSSHFSLFVVGIILVSTVPVIFEVIKGRVRKNRLASTD
jgi:membrane-associated protein